MSDLGRPRQRLYAVMVLCLLSGQRDVLQHCDALLPQNTIAPIAFTVHRYVLTNLQQHIENKAPGSIKPRSVIKKTVDTATALHSRLWWWGYRLLLHN